MTLANACDDLRRDVHSQSIADTVDRIELKLDDVSSNILRDHPSVENELFKLRIGSHWVAFTQNKAGYVSSVGAVRS